MARAPESAASTKAPLVLLCGDDDFAVRQHARQLYNQWSAELGGMDHEIVDGAAANSGEALRALARLREALQTLPFFGSGKAIWLRDCTFLGDDKVAATKDVNEQLANLAGELRSFSWLNVRLLISAGKVDKRKLFFKTLDKLGSVESYDGWSLSDKDWTHQAEHFARQEIRNRSKEIADDALAELVQRVGPNARLLANEVEKLSLFAGDRPKISLTDVEAIAISNKFSRAFAFADALGDRDLPRLLRCLDEELWEIRSKVDKEKNEFGLLYGLITKVRAMLQLKEMVREGWVKSTRDYNAFKLQLERIPSGALPEDRRYNPLALNPYVLFRALPQAARYSTEELIRAMDLLLQCNQKLIFSNLDEALVLQQTLVEIVGAQTPKAALAAAG